MWCDDSRLFKKNYEWSYVFSWGFINKDVLSRYRFNTYGR